MSAPAPTLEDETPKAPPPDDRPFPIPGYVAILGALAVPLFLGAAAVYWAAPADTVFVFLLALTLLGFFAVAAVLDALMDRCACRHDTPAKPQEAGTAAPLQDS